MNFNTTEFFISKKFIQFIFVYQQCRMKRVNDDFGTRSTRVYFRRLLRLAGTTIPARAMDRRKPLGGSYTAPLQPGALF